MVVTRRDRRDLLRAIADAVVVERLRTPGPVGVLQLVRRGVPEVLVVGRRGGVPDVGQVEVVGARVRPVDDRRGAVIDLQQVLLVIVGEGVPVVQAVAVDQRLHDVGLRLAHDARRQGHDRRRRVLLGRRRRDAARRVAHVIDDAARRIGDLRDAVGGVVDVGRGVHQPRDRALVGDDVAAHRPDRRASSSAA